jgi:hypothetical protein
MLYIIYVVCCHLCGMSQVIYVVCHICSMLYIIYVVCHMSYTIMLVCCFTFIWSLIFYFFIFFYLLPTAC